MRRRRPRWSLASLSVGWHLHGPMEEHPVQHQVEVTLHYEVQGPLAAHREPELPQPGRSRRTRRVRQRQPRCLDVVPPGHRVVAVAVDPLVKASEAPALQHSRGNAAPRAACLTNGPCRRSSGIGNMRPSRHTHHRVATYSTRGCGETALRRACGEVLATTSGGPPTLRGPGMSLDNRSDRVPHDTPEERSSASIRRLVECGSTTAREMRSAAAADRGDDPEHRRRPGREGGLRRGRRG